MQNTSKISARILTKLLKKHGVKNVIVSPGSRNAPLIIACAREDGLKTDVVIDERSAAFIALGISIAEGGAPVAMVCTSGTAPLNYGPALTEAYYRHIPLVAVTADRPEEWIDQDDSQTIKQPGIFSNFCKGTFDIPAENDDPDTIWMINRKINDALLLAVNGTPGPVHINVRLREPLGNLTEYDDCSDRKEYRKIETVDTEKFIGKEISGVNIPLSGRSCPKIMIVCGFMPENNLSSDLIELSCKHNIVVLHEGQSNIKGNGCFVDNIDATLRYIDPDDTANAPDVVVTMGGALTSRKIKTYLRNLENVSHWNVGKSDISPDCFRHLGKRLPFRESDFTAFLLNYMQKNEAAFDSQFKQRWINASAKAHMDAELYAQAAPWSDFKAMEFVMKSIPDGWNVHLSNGTSVRYAQLFDYSKALSIHSNRGVSGIDGCTSTAIGFASESAMPTVLITGDMSMQYDIGALATTFIPTNFKIIVLNNKGGGIFRYIGSTSKLPELEKYFVADVRLPLQNLSEAYGFSYFSVDNMEDLKSVFHKFCNEDDSPAILEIKTDGELSAKVLSDFLDIAKY